MININELKKLQESLENDNFIIEAINYGIVKAVADAEYQTVYSIDSEYDFELEIDEAIRYYMDLGFDIDNDIEYEENEEYNEDEADKYCTKGTITVSWK